MTVSEAKKNSNRRWDEKNIKRISLCVKKDYAATIERRAAELGKPVNRYIVDLIRQDIDASSGK